MIYKKEVGISSDFLGVLNLIWIFSSRGENQNRTFQMEIATKETPRNIKQHVCGLLREALSNKEAEGNSRITFGEVFVLEDTKCGFSITK